MAFESLREDVWQANKAIVEAGLVELTWGNASGVDREADVLVIKPSGIDYSRITPSDLVVVSLETGEVVEGELQPSSDTPTHRYLYRQFETIGGIVHTHSSHAVIWAQAERDLPCLGTTHADHFHGPIPVTRRMQEMEIQDAYEENTGVVIVERFRVADVNPERVPGVLVAGHGPFAWGPTPREAAENAVALEAVARMALHTYALNPDVRPLDQVLLDKHFLRKHGADAYYGQREANKEEQKGEKG
ncbi:MAG: L-ribulose-5-phosphate 4-epimerase AraD [Rhodothermales bacterium]